MGSAIMHPDNILRVRFHHGPTINIRFVSIRCPLRVLEFLCSCEYHTVHELGLMSANPERFLTYLIAENSRLNDWS
jgi:hypothetical protein